MLPEHGVIQEATVSVMLSQDPAADALLERDPLALLLGMLLDQQVPMERRAFAAPYELRQRLGHDLDARDLAEYEPEALAEIFARQPALHRYPKSMAGRVQEVSRVLVERYDGTQDHGTQDHGTQDHGTQDHGTQDHGVGP